MSPRREPDRRAIHAFDHWLTLVPLLISVVATATLVIGA